MSQPLDKLFVSQSKGYSGISNYAFCPVLAAKWGRNKNFEMERLHIDAISVILIMHQPSFRIPGTSRDN